MSEADERVCNPKLNIYGDDVKKPGGNGGGGGGER